MKVWGVAYPGIAPDLNIAIGFRAPNLTFDSTNIQTPPQNHTSLVANIEMQIASILSDLTSLRVCVGRISVNPEQHNGTPTDLNPSRTTMQHLLS